MGHDGTNIEAGFEEPGQAVPGFKQSAAGDAVHSDALEDDLIRHVDTHLPFRNAEQCDAAAVLDIAEALMDRARVDGHLERNVHPLAVSQAHTAVHIVSLP